MWQGKVFSLDPNNKKYGYFYGSLDAGLPAYGDMLGICGINCYHSFSPYIEGSPRADQTGKKSAEENAKQYENQQKQRAYERQLRALKRQQVALKSAGYEDDAKLIQDKINAKSSQYKQFLKDTGLTRVSMLESIKSSKEIFEYKPIEGLKKTPTTEMLNYIDAHSNSELITPQTAKEYKIIGEKSHIPAEFTPNGIVDRKTVKGDKLFVERYYYNSKGKIYKDISNNSHGEKKKYGKNGEHAHDWIWENGKSKRFERELTDKEKEETSDILIN